ncbi:MAG: tRNA (guanosine(46)-N7)-methyltransferase TrmB [Deltaproteobacteria bacterium]|nr:tRNA (guanosine(46)-N7)-methyltransferase TrmB [Deltaproteobacteria bacterium]
MEEDIEIKDWQKPFQIFPALPDIQNTSDWILEIGPGNGKFILWMAQNHPQKTFFTLELRNMRYQNVVEKTKKLKLNNLISVHGDARYCLTELLEKETLSEIFILFPDPWFKRRHYKHRLINEERTELFHKLLKTVGKVWVATDDAPYAEHIQQVFLEKHWEIQEGKSLFPTYFETKWKKMGRTIHYFCFVKKLL